MSKTTSRTPLTTCPRCGHLCVGPSILPCSHLLCRKCLLLLLDTEPGRDVDCPTCHSTVVPAHTPGPRHAKQFPVDVVMERLVIGKLTEQVGGKCCVPHPPPSCPPSHICLDCGDMFCDSCSHMHRNSSVSKHHTLRTLEPPQSMDAPSKHCQDDAEGRQDDQDNLLQHAVNTEVELFHQAMSTCDLVIDGLKDLLTQRQEDRYVLETYNHHLLTDDVSFRDVIRQRFRCVRQECTSVAEVDMENLRQMQSTKIPGNKVDTRDTSQSNLSANPLPKVPQSEGIQKKGKALWQRLHLHLTWTSDNTTVWVSLSVLVILLLALLLVILCPSPAVPYTADRVALQPLDALSSSLSALTDSPSWNHSCSVHYDDDITDVLVMRDGRVVLAMDQQQSIVVLSSSGLQTVKLQDDPRALAELPGGLIAVICPWMSTLMLVSLDSTEHQIQRIQTEAIYWTAVAHPVDNALIVGRYEELGVDVITPQGKVIQTLVDSSHTGLKQITSLAVANGDLLMTDVKSKQILRISLSDPGPSPEETLAKSLTSFPVDTIVDKAGNAFVILRNGDVVMRSPEGHYRTLVTGRASEATVGWRLALHEDRLLVVTVTGTFNGFKSDITEYYFMDQ